ncbi:helix-turn-helix domain-containing protein [Angustibacter sp. McL0619]|uniref:AlbA family DNA-binding domain-containing protein n=1 Tax=Angustibacter sp. McL0619 TaxID=3415676 RepID=UPI003CF86A80
MPWTPLHAALGVSNVDLSFDLIQAATAQRLSERADLDWKAQLPLTSADSEGKRDQQAELAKDVAAMANSGGGMVVYGVREAQDGDGPRADSIEPVGQVSESTLQQIRQVAGNLIYPPVAGLELTPLAPANAPADGVLAMLVPDSPEAPHLIHPKGRGEWFASPWRDGPHTSWMVERQIAAAYREREQFRRMRAAELLDLHEALGRASGTAGGASWILAVATPDRPVARPRALTPPRADLSLATATNSELVGYGALRLTAQARTRRGLRLFYRSAQDAGFYNSHPRGRVEVHGDGSVAVAFTRDGNFPGEPGTQNHIAIEDLESVARDLLVLLLTHRRAVQVPGDYVFRLGLAPSTQLFRRRDPGEAAFIPFDEQQRVLDFRTVEGPILLSHGIEAGVETWFEVIEDAVHQTGTELWYRPTYIVSELSLDG